MKEESQLLLAFDSEAENTTFLKHFLKTLYMHLLYWKKKCVRSFWVKYFVTVHEESQLLLAFDSEVKNTTFLKHFLKNLYMHLLYWKEICIRFILIKYFVTVHYRHQILLITEINDIMCISWQHMDTLNIVTRHFEFQNLI